MSATYGDGMTANRVSGCIRCDRAIRYRRDDDGYLCWECQGIDPAVAKRLACIATAKMNEEIK